MNVFSLLTIKNNIAYLECDATVRQALEKMDYYKFSVTPIIDDKGRYYGTLSEGDLLRFIKNDCDFDIHRGEDTKIKDIYRYRSYQALKINSSIEDLIALSMEQNFVPIVDDRNMFIGIVGRKEILKSCQNYLLKSLK